MSYIIPNIKVNSLEFASDFEIIYLERIKLDFAKGVRVHN
jgi:hypothetical protein